MPLVCLLFGIVQSVCTRHSPSFLKLINGLIVLIGRIAGVDVAMDGLFDDDKMEHTAYGLVNCRYKQLHTGRFYQECRP